MRNLFIQTHFVPALDSDSIALDFGAYHGEWACVIAAQHGCAVEAYEPVPDFYDELVRNAASYPTIRPHNVAVGPADGTRPIWLCNDASSFYEVGSVTMPVTVVDVASVIPERVDVLKMNVEGEEYAILQRMVDLDLMRRVVHLLVQWHSVPDSISWGQSLARDFQTTHEPLSSGSWDHWRRRQ